MAQLTNKSNKPIAVHGGHLIDKENSRHNRRLALLAPLRHLPWETPTPSHHAG